MTSEERAWRRAEDKRILAIVQAATAKPLPPEPTEEEKKAYEHEWKRRRRNPLGRRKYWARSSAGVHLNNTFIYGRE